MRREIIYEYAVNVMEEVHSTGRTTQWQTHRDHKNTATVHTMFQIINTRHSRSLHLVQPYRSCTLARASMEHSLRCVAHATFAALCSRLRLIPTSFFTSIPRRRMFFWPSVYVRTFGHCARCRLEAIIPRHDLLKFLYRMRHRWTVS